MRLGQDCERRVVSHGERGFHAVFRHGQDLVFDILVCVAEHLVKAVPDILRVHGDLPVGNRKSIQMQKISVQPFAVRTSARVIGLALLVGDDPLLFCIHQKDAPGFQASLLYDVLRRDIQYADL